MSDSYFNEESDYSEENICDNKVNLQLNIFTYKCGIILHNIFTYIYIAYLQFNIVNMASKKPISLYRIKVIIIIILQPFQFASEQKKTCGNESHKKEAKHIHASAADLLHIRIKNIDW